MDGSTLERNIDAIDENKELIINDQYNYLANLLKHSLLLGAEKLLMARKSSSTLDCSNFELHDGNELNTPPARIEDKNTSKQNKKVCRKYKHTAFQSSSAAIVSRNEDLGIPKLVSNNDQFSLNITSFLAVLMLKLVGFQISLFMRFFAFPIRVLNFWLMLLLFPFQTLTRIRDHTKKALLNACYALYSRLFSFVCNRLKSPKSLLKLTLLFGKAIFCSTYVFLVLAGLLVSGFVFSGFVTRNFLEEPILTTETLNFDYTQTSPAAVVPITPSLVNGVPSKKKASASGNLGRRAIPYNHKMRLTVSLTLPESDYNRKLGIFQLRVESLSAKGKVIVGSSYPTMLRFKSQPIRVIETLFKSVPLITGLQSEVQNLKIVINQFTEGHDPTASFKVVLEHRAEFQAAGSGAPELYAASLDIASDLPPLKRIAWNWRRTIFVWVGFSTFVGEITVVLIFCRPIFMPGFGRSKKSQMREAQLRTKAY